MGGLVIQAHGLVLPIAKNLEPFDWLVEPGTCHGLVGENGSGKTTLIRVLLSQLNFLAGEVKIGQFTLPLRSRKERCEFANRVAFIPQDAVGSLDPTWPAWKIVTEPLVIQGKETSKNWLRKSAQALLEEVGLGPEYLDCRPSEMSGGQCQRLCIARAIATRPGLILADEPVSALDPVLQVETLMLLARLKERLGTTLVMVSHSLGLVCRFADHVSVMLSGRIVDTISVQAIERGPLHEATERLAQAETAALLVLDKACGN